MALCRIYLFTYQRPKLLPRAVESLLAQTMKDWKCEVHNDDPDDSNPGIYIASLNDDRFTVNNHGVNLGGSRSFNLAFQGCLEKYISILEDDNWWEPTFLQEMVTLMEGQPNLHVAWSNMHIWKEGLNGDWINTHRTVWPEKADRLFPWPQPEQAFGALHSNGAMLLRSENARNYIIPDNVLFDSIELVRERTFKHPLYLYSKPLANFSVTAQTHRSATAWKWTACQIMQLSSLVMSAQNTEQVFFELLHFYREKKANAVIDFFLANLFLIKKNSFYKGFRLKDWFLLARWLLKNNWKLASLKKHLKSQSNIYSFLLNTTVKRYDESINI